MDILPELTEAGDQHEASSAGEVVLPPTLSKWLYISHNHPYISSSGMADATLFYCYLCRDGCVKCIAIYVAVLVYTFCQPVILSFLVCELC